MDNEQKGKSQYSNSNAILEPHESLTLETRDNGTVGIKFYSYQLAVNPATFAAKLKTIKEELESKGFYIEGHTENMQVKAEISNDNAKGERKITVKADNHKAAVKAYNESA